MNATLSQPLVASDDLAVLGPALHHGRNVVMSMRGYAELLARQQAPAEKSGEWAERIVHHLDRLDEFYSRLEPLRSDGRRPPETVSLALTLTSACRQAERTLRERGFDPRIRLELGADPIVRAQARPLATAIAAFVENAIEADPAGEARVGLRRDADDRWSIQIEDDGPGLDDQSRDGYGRPFFTTKSDRLGLGVYTSRILLERDHLSFTVTRGREGGLRVSIQERPWPSGGDR